MSVSNRPKRRDVPPRAWFEHWSEVWEALAGDSRADILADVRRRFGTLAGCADGDFVVRVACLRELEQRSLPVPQKEVVMAGLHRCPVLECKAEVPRHLLMCRAHWRMVSWELQRQVYDAWERVLHDDGSDGVECVAAHRKACTLAIAHLNVKLAEARQSDKVKG
jgi:hypothetical protein